MRRSIQLNDALIDYVQAKGVREHPVLARCRAETAALGAPARMQIGPEQGALMALLVKLTGAERILEIGVFTGYSSLALSLALPEHGRLFACDVSEEWTNRARGYWADAGVAHKIVLALKPARETLDRLIGAGEAGTFDLAFIDADKESYDAYYERCLTLLRPGGLIIVDNVLWNGAVIDARDTTPDTRAIRALNDKLAGDPRIDLALLPMGDGITLARKRDA